MRALPQTLSGTPDRDTASTGDRRGTGRTQYQSTDPEWLKEERQTAAASQIKFNSGTHCGIEVLMLCRGWTQLQARRRAGDLLSTGHREKTMFLVLELVT